MNLTPSDKLKTCSIHNWRFWNVVEWKKSGKRTKKSIFMYSSKWQIWYSI